MIALKCMVMRAQFKRERQGHRNRRSRSGRDSDVPHQFAGAYLKRTAVKRLCILCAFCAQSRRRSPSL